MATPEDICKLLFQEPVVGLLTNVGSDGYRFSHLTLQEYLAARCLVRLCGHDVKAMFKHLTPLHSRWKREVLQFTACMVDEKIFKKFCRAVLKHGDESGTSCELVRDFLGERGESAAVERMLQDKLLALRGAQSLVAGLCHPSSLLRDLLLSEMRQFRTPMDPFGDGTAEHLKAIATDTSCMWHKRCAAILSLAQIAQMEHCSEGAGRAETLT